MAFKSRQNVAGVGNKKSTPIATHKDEISVNKEMKATSKSEREIEGFRLMACDVLDKLEHEHGIDFYDENRKPGMYMNMSKVNGNKLNLNKVHKKKVSDSDKSRLSLIEKLKSR